MVYDTGYGMERRDVPKAPLKIHYDQRSLRVKHSEWQEILLLEVANELRSTRFAAVRSVLSESCKQMYG